MRRRFQSNVGPMLSSLGLSAVLMICGCARSISNKTTCDNPSKYDERDEVAFVIIGQEEPRYDYVKWNNEMTAFYAESPIKECVRITNSVDVTNLTYLIDETSESDSAGATFSGVLSNQIYVSKRGRVIAHVFIINNDSTVMIGSGAIYRDGKSYLVRDDGKAPYRCVKSKAYCEAVYSLMQKACPEQVEEMDKFYRTGIGRSLRDLLFP